jgi:hypothetical protein
LGMDCQEKVLTRAYAVMYSQIVTN